MMGLREDVGVSGMARRLGLAAAIIAAAAAVAQAGPTPARAVCSNPPAGPAHTRAVLEALRSTRDRWGEQLLRRPGGPSVGAVRSYLPSLLLARGPKQRSLTRSGVYYLPIADPPAAAGTSSVNLHVADGGEIVARRVGGRSLRILVGPSGTEAYGACLARLSTPTLRGGWLPVLQVDYTDSAGTSYSEESFSTRLDGVLTAAVAIEVNAQAPTTLRFGPVVVHLAQGDQKTVTVAWTPDGGARILDGDAYLDVRTRFEKAWRERLGHASGVSVPEPLVENALRALLVQNLTLGWRYSVGNPYEEFSFPEGPDVAQTMASYGFRDVASAILAESLRQRPEPYANWKRGEKLYVYAKTFALFRDGAEIARVTPTLAGYVEALARSLGRNSLLARERFSSDIPDQVYGFHGQAVALAGLRAIADVWEETGRRDLAKRAHGVGTRLARGLRAAVRTSQRRPPDGSLFVPARLLDQERPYRSLVEARAASYWNLVMPFGFATGFFPPGSADARGVIDYMLSHGSRFLGLVRAGAYALYGRGAPYPVSGTDQVYGVNVARFFADNDRPDQLVLSLYGELGAAMTPGTFVAGEGASLAPLDGRRYRAMYLPPNAAANAAFLETLRVMLVHETRRGLQLAFATPRAWLRQGGHIAVSGLPTRFGEVSFSIESSSSDARIHIDVPSRPVPPRLAVRVRLPNGRRLARVTLGGRPVRFDRATGTIVLDGERGSLDLVATTS
jgi:hypothetical protein